MRLSYATSNMLSHLRYSLRRLHPPHLSPSVGRCRPRCSFATAATNPIFVGNEVRSPYPDVSTDVPKGGFPSFVMDRFEEFSSAPAVTDAHSGASLTFIELKHAVCSVAAALQKNHGFKTGDCLALYSPNHVHYFTVSHAVASLGGVVTPINPLYQGKELDYQLENSKATLIIAHSSVADHAVSAAARTNGRISPSSIYVMDDEQRQDARPFSDLLTSSPTTSLPSVPIDPDSTVQLPFSSGTTGLPKGVELTHRNLIVNLQQMYPGEGEHYAEGSVCYCPLPFFHIYGNIVGNNLTFLHGVHLVTAPRFEFEAFLRTVEEMKVSRAYLVPPIILALAKEPKVDDYDVSSLKHVMSAAAPLGADLQSALSTRIDAVVKQAWGMTELSPVGTVTPEEGYDPSVATSGVLVPNSKALIVDVDTGEPLDPISEGELWIAGPHLMKGYHDNPAANSRDLVDVEGERYFRTGDIARFDEEGRMFITDRLKELVKVKGFQVAPAEIEDLLCSHPGIRDACVVGVEDDEAGELPAAIVVLKDLGGEVITPEEIKEWVAGQVVHYKRLKGGVKVVEEVPKTASGKLLRREVKKLLL